MTYTIGVIGLGNIGSVIAKRLGKRFNVMGYDADPQKVDLAVGNNINCKGSLKELSSLSNIILLSLPKPEVSIEVVQEISPFLNPGATIIETSTVAPGDMIILSNICSPYQVKVVDVALLGGISHASDGTIELLVGGDPESINNIRSILTELSTNIQVLGGIGTGMAAKIINNAVAHSVMVLIVEAAAMAVSMGIPVEVAYKLLNGETVLQRPLTHRFGERILGNQYEGGMSTNNARKDSLLALDLAQELGVPLFVIQSTQTVYEIAVQEGYGNLDYASVAKLWEKWTDVDFTKS
jgi:3-hydroxyisobutyrate dehydrogenase-like beta-hydroxyacid dehydrogenase